MAAVDRAPQKWRRHRAIAIGAAVMLAAAPAAAATPASSPPAGMYRAVAIVTGTDMRQRPWGMAQCLREALVKVSGDPRLRDDPRVLALAAHAERFVAAYRYADLMAGIPLHDDQGTYDRPHALTVDFDRTRIDRILAGLGERPWRGPRPVVVPVLLVKGPKPPPYVLSADNPGAAASEQRGAFATAAGQFGMAARLPRNSELAAWGLTAGRFPATAPPPADADPEEAVVVGTLEWREALPGWVGHWTTRWHGAEHRWGISGVNYDAAFRDIVGGVELLASGHGAPD